MALTGMQIYKSLPKTNCKECGFPTCMAFAMQVGAKKKALTDCPHISEDAKSELSDASAPPMKLVKIGPEGKQFQIGAETVMFRHEEKFQNSCGIAIKVPASLSDADAAAKIEAVNKCTYERVGETLKASLCAVEIGDADPAGRAKMAAEKSVVPLMLIGHDAAKMKAAVEAVKDQRPLISCANKSNIDAFAEIAAGAKAPLAIRADDLETLADLAKTAKDKGVEDLVLSFSGKDMKATLQALTKVRRAALKKSFRILGYPSMVEIDAPSPEEETVAAATFAAKYASIVVVSGTEAWEILPVLTTVQSIYTDPQKPNVVEAKLYPIGNVNENSPVLFTTNFSLTYFSVVGEVERSKIPSYIVAIDTEGLGVLNAYAGDKLSAESVVKAVAATGVAEKVKHRKLIIPGLLPIFRAEIEETSEWTEVIIGPEQASKIPAFLNEIWK